MLWDCGIVHTINYLNHPKSISHAEDAIKIQKDDADLLKLIKSMLGIR